MTYGQSLTDNELTGDRCPVRLCVPVKPGEQQRDKLAAGEARR